MGLRCAQQTPHGPNLAQPSAKMRTRWPNFGQYKPHQGSKKEKERDREPNLKIQKSRIQRVCVGHGTFSSLSLLLCLLDLSLPFPFCLYLSLSSSWYLSLCLSLSFFVLVFHFLSVSRCLSLSPLCLPLWPSLFPLRHLSSIPAIRLWGSIALPPSCTTGAGTSGVPAASFARRGLTARVHSKCTEGRVSRRRQPQADTRLQLRLVERTDSVNQSHQQKG